MTSEKARALNQQIESSVNALAEETDQFRKSEVFTKWLNAMAQFSHYSFHNQILISIQRPEARRVAGFNAWRKLGRYVRKGSKGIAILAPCISRKPVETDDSDTQKLQRLVGFRTCWIFAEEDTEGQPLPQLTTSAESGGEELLPRLEEASKRLNVVLDYDDGLTSGVDGFSSGGRIVVRAGLSTPAKCAVIVHELCHEDLHQGDHHLEARVKSKLQRELEAEATAYVVMRHFGIEHVASNYLATYSVDGAQLRQSLETISAAARRLIKAIEGGNTFVGEASIAESLSEESAPA
jgi:hypothetical protein